MIRQYERVRVILGSESRSWEYLCANTKESIEETIRQAIADYYGGKRPDDLIVCVFRVEYTEERTLLTEYSTENIPEDWML